MEYKMTANEAGFNGAIEIYNGTKSPLKVIFARSTQDDKGPEVWANSWNPNINSKIKNTFIWWAKSFDPTLYYRNKDGKLFKVNFEPVENL
jgi:hypothetical protein